MVQTGVSFASASVAEVLLTQTQPARAADHGVEVAPVYVVQTSFQPEPPRVGGHELCPVEEAAIERVRLDQQVHIRPDALAAKLSIT